ncbi:GIY-YIG nuclease family protein [Spirulina sp. CCNP1310]|uniref:GIY-YIG nuclease family protein n=1 Tax=Spirulina sp. CCNP1310 TaxID=3110249 RepID=UPI002B209567|nr:GIY-YIG nuclease family protein [Spirulina sp. CCNP1310]MEA5420878.1 GIY-YIG nuclease family protein [Spirulina sp. CCNP1310]
MSDFPSLVNLDYLPYLEGGEIANEWQQKIGVYAIFDADNRLQLVDYSRDIYLSLRQHLVRCPEQCYWLKGFMISRPSRSILEEIRTAWIAENGNTPPGNGEEGDRWHQPIDAKATMTSEEQAQLTKTDDLGKIKLLKKVARRVEAEILTTLAKRGVRMEIRFNPKLKEQGLLDVK